ncbi:hypothetical protein HOR27_gp224 [Escherichia phage ESCO5]|uniref:Uncharacterized protein n=1 Tax=Escherichia phage ESCO5 TaxID=1897495 RepID=A0A1D8EQM0_9CAUD|nr:hypothetical protein HOR27_gp224 [Escherichia phage ESCO5]AOT23330.1 hypothetical protein ESCO5_00087 [Escherichia phage ESCO5]EIH0451185.1 hypothetical protein [Escherichia coli]UPW40283.1 hypothetical protein REC_00255 [Escherichia phage vB_EcoM_REC]
MTERSKIAVETVYGNYTSLTLVEKNVVGLDNSFYFQILIIQGGDKKLTARVETSEIIEATVTNKEFISLQDTIRNVIDEEGKAATIKLGGFPVQIVHFPNGEIGVGIGKGKYLLEQDDMERLRSFCAKLM